MDFEINDLSFTESNTARRHEPAELNYELWAMAHMEAPQSKTNRFMVISGLIHAGLILLVAVLAVPLAEQAKTETISIEIAEPAHPIARGHHVPLTHGSRTPAPMVKETTADRDDGAPAIAAAAAPKIHRIRAAKVATHSHSRAAAHPLPVAHAVKAAPPAAPKLATIDDIDAPDIDQSSEEVRHSWTPSAYSDDLDNDLAKVDRRETERVQAEKQNLDQAADSLDAANDQALADAQEKTRAEVDALKAESEARRARDGQAIAAAIARENAAREAALAREAAARRAAATAAARAQGHGQGHGLGRGNGNGAGSHGTPAQGIAAGAPNGIRSLDQLRQRPGNPIPQYSAQERLRRQQGKVTYYAYVRRDGSLTGFRQVSSTGYANLDAKTLIALRRWKFYPGQEGWVELPFRWDLKGGAQSIDGLLRTRRSDISQR